MGDREGGPDTASEEKRSRRVIAALAMAGLAIVVGVGATWALTHRPATDTAATFEPPGIEPAQPTTPSPTPDATTTPVPTDTIEPTQTATFEPSTTPSPTGTVPAASRVRAPYVTYRRAGVLYLSREDGSGAIPVVTSASGVFALSPDARSLAYVDSARRLLVIVDLSKQATLTVGPARQVTPVWSPDSAWLLGVRDVSGGAGTEVFRVSRATGKAEPLGPGSKAAVSPDGSVIALIPTAAGEVSDVLELIRGGRPFKTLRAPAPIVDVVLGNGQAFVATSRAGSDAAAEGVWSLTFGDQRRLLVGAQGSHQRGDFGMLTLAPDGTRLAFARTGDDGYSRMALVRTTGGIPIPVSQRRDAYPLGWTADSSAVFAIEGNSWQGEQTALVRVAPDGHREAVIVSGADR